MLFHNAFDDCQAKASAFFTRSHIGFGQAAAVLRRQSNAIVGHSNNRHVFTQSSLDDYAASFTSIRLISGALMLWLVVKIKNGKTAGHGSWASALATAEPDTPRAPRLAWCYRVPHIQTFSPSSFDDNSRGRGISTDIEAEPGKRYTAAVWGVPDYRVEPTTRWADEIRTPISGWMPVETALALVV